MLAIHFRPLWFVALLTLTAGGAHASIPRYDDILPISQVRPGMKGYGLTVFRGTKIERFDVEVVAVIKKGHWFFPGHDMILVRLAGGPITRRGANLIQGMSGSPVYVNGKIIGAFSMGQSFSKEPLGGVTPIEEMLEAWDPKLPQSPTAARPDNRPYTLSLPKPIQVGGRRIEKIVCNAPLKSGLRSQGHTLVLHPCTTVITVSGLSRAAHQRLAKWLEPYNVEVVQGPSGGQKSGFKGSPLVPGAMFSMMLVTGDFIMGAGGTVSYRRGNRLLGFGHPFLGIGPLEAPLCSAYVHDVYPLMTASQKIWSSGPTVGSSVQDRNFAVSGVIGKIPKTIPITVHVQDRTTGRGRLFRAQAVAHPNLYAGLVSATVAASIAEIRNTPGAAMARVETTVEAEEIGKITRSNIVFDARSIDVAATADLDEILGILTANPFYRLGIKSAEVKVEIETAQRTAQIERIFLKEGRFAPGETVEVGVVVKPYKQSAVTKKVQIPIPPNTPTGRYVLHVRGGAVPTPFAVGGTAFRAAPQQNPDQAPPVSIRQMVSRFDEREKNDEIVARLLLPTTAVNVEGERLSGLPPSLDAVMRSSKSSGVRMERDEVRVVERTDWVISGQQMLAVNVQRRELQETASSGGAAGGGASGGGSPSSGSGGATYSDSDAEGLSALLADTEDVLALAAQSRSRNRGAAGPATARKPEEKSGPTASPASPAQGDKGTTAAPGESKSDAGPSPESEKPVGRIAQVWRQTTRSDFAAGVPDGVTVTTQGELCLTRSLKRFATSTESFLWCLIPDGQGGLYAGTGTQGQVLHVDSSGRLKTVARLPEVAVHSLLLAPDGTLWAATGPNGRTYRITPDDASTVLHQAEEKYALALARDSKGNLFVGTGGGSGVIHRIAPDGKASVFFKTSEEHVLSLATDRDDNLYAGTSSDGIVYRITPDGRASVLYDAPEQSITAVAVNSRGEVYAATAPKGVLYRIAPDGTAKAVYDKAPAAFNALRIASDDTVYAGGGSAVYAVRPDDTVIPFHNRTDVDILALAVGEDGTLYAGTGNVAEVYAAAPIHAQSAGTYESVVHDAKQTARWGAIRWTASVPDGTRLAVHIRTGNVAEPDSTWTDWTAPRMEPDGGRITSPPARFIQYRVTLESDLPALSPSLRDIAITYLPRNQPPKVAFQTPTGGERWAGQQTIKWEASDPDKDTLSFELYYSADNGATWKPLSQGTESRGSGAEPASPAPDARKGRRPPSVADVTTELDRHPDLPQSLRDAVIARAKEVNAEYDEEQNGAAPAGAGDGEGKGSEKAAATRATTRSLDTKMLPDGLYVLKVVATDRPSNPTESLAAEAVSEPFVVSNAPPTLHVLKSALQVHADRTVMLEGIAMQNLIPITAVQYRVDGGDWIAAVPADGIFDGVSERFTIRTTPLEKGVRTLEVKAFNAANGTAAERVTVEVR